MIMAESSMVLEEEIDVNYEPTEEDILEYAQWLGMELPEEKELLWIAGEGLKAPLPEHWKPCRTEDDEIYYFNFSTGESVWDHPCDEQYRNLYKEEKAKLQARREAQQRGQSHESGDSQPQTQVGQVQQQQQQGGAEGRSSLARQASLPPQPGGGQQQKSLPRMGSLQSQADPQDQGKRRKAHGDRQTAKGQSPLFNQQGPGYTRSGEPGSNPESPRVGDHPANSRDKSVSRSSSGKGHNSASESEGGSQRASGRPSTPHSTRSRRASVGGEYDLPRDELASRATAEPHRTSKRLSDPHPSANNARNFGTWSPEVSGSRRASPSALLRGGSGDLTVPSRNMGDWTDSEADDPALRGIYQATQSRSQGANQQGHGSTSERIKLVSNTLRRSESGNPLGVIGMTTVLPQHQQQQHRQGRSSDSGRDLVGRQQQQQQQQQQRAQQGYEGSPSSAREIRQLQLHLQLAEAKQEQQEQQHQSLQQRQMQRQQSGSQETPRGNSMDEARRLQLIERQRDHDDWKLQVQEQEKGALLKLKNASRRRLEKYEAECDTRFEKLREEREALLARREKAIRKLGDRLNQPMDAAMREARNVVGEEARALISEERDAAVELAQEEGEREKQRMMGIINEELGAQLALERQRMNIDPGSTAMHNQESAEEDRNNPEALVRQWKATMEQEQAAASQGRTSGQTARIKVLVAEEEMSLLEEARKEASQRVQQTVEQEEKKEYDQLMRQMRERIRARIVEEERKILQQERVEMLDRVTEKITAEEERRLDERKAIAEKMEKEVTEETERVKQEKLGEARQRVEAEAAEVEKEEMQAMMETVETKVREMEERVLANERAKVIDWVRKRVENEGRDMAEQYRAEVMARVEEEEMRLSEAMMAEMEDRVRAQVREEEDRLLGEARAAIWEGRNGEQRANGGESMAEIIEQEKRALLQKSLDAKLEDLRKQMEMRVVDQIASEEATLIVAKRKEMEVHVEAMMKEEERRMMTVQRRISNKWTPERGGSVGKVDGIVWSMEKTHAEAMREIQAKVAGEKQNMEAAMKEHLAVVRREMEETEKREMKDMKMEMEARLQKMAEEEESAELEKLRAGIKERAAQTLGEEEHAVAEELGGVLKRQLEDEMRTKVEAELKGQEVALREKLKGQMAERVRQEVEAEEEKLRKEVQERMRGLGEAFTEDEEGEEGEHDEEVNHVMNDIRHEMRVRRARMLLDLETELEKERKRRWVEMERGLEEELMKAKQEREAASQETSKEQPAPSEQFEKRLEEEERKMWELKTAELERSIEEELEKEREIRYSKARRAMEVSLRNQLMTERKGEAMRKREEEGDKVSEGDEVRSEGSRSEQKAWLMEDLMKEVRAEVEEYKEKLMAQADAEEEERRRKRREGLEQEREFDKALERDLARIDAERIVQTDAMQKNLSAELEDFRAQVKMKFQSDCARIRREAERNLERVKNDWEDKLEQKMDRMRTETQQKVERARMHLEDELGRQLEGERAHRMAKLTEELEEEETLIRHEWKVAIEREDLSLKLAEDAALSRMRSGKEQRGGEGLLAGARGQKEVRNERPGLGAEEGPAWERRGDRGATEVRKGEAADGGWRQGSSSERAEGLGRYRPELPSLTEWNTDRDDASRRSGNSDVGSNRDVGLNPSSRTSEQSIRPTGQPSPIRSPRHRALSPTLGSVSSSLPSPVRPPSSPPVEPVAFEDTLPDKSEQQEAAEEEEAAMEPKWSRSGSESRAAGNAQREGAPGGRDLGELQDSKALTVPNLSAANQAKGGKASQKATEEEPEEGPAWEESGEPAEEEEGNKEVLPEASGNLEAVARESLPNRRRMRASPTGGMESDRGQGQKWSEGGWSTRGSHRRNRHRRRTTDNESDDYYSAWTDTATEQESMDGDRQPSAPAARRRPAEVMDDVDENQPTEEAKPTMAERAKLFVAEQQRFLQERQTVIEQAKADWRRRLQSLEQVSDAEERRRMANYLMEVKATLDQHARQLQEDMRQLRTLRFTLPGYPSGSRFDALVEQRRMDADLPSFARSLWRMDTNQSRDMRRMDTNQSRDLTRLDTNQSRDLTRLDTNQSRDLTRLDTNQSRDLTRLDTNQSRDLPPINDLRRLDTDHSAAIRDFRRMETDQSARLDLRRMDTDLSRALSRMDTDHSRRMKRLDTSDHSSPRFWDKRPFHSQNNSWNSQPASPSSTADLGMGYDEPGWRRAGTHRLDKGGSDRRGSLGRRPTIDDEPWMEELHRIGREGDEGRRSFLDGERWGEGRHTDDESPTHAWRASARDLGKGRAGASDHLPTSLRSPFYQRELVGYLEEMDERQLTRDMVKQHSNWLNRFHDEMMATGLPATRRSTSKNNTPMGSASGIRLSMDERRGIRLAHGGVPKLRFDLDNERELVINILPK